MFFTFTLNNDEQVIDLLETLDGAYALPDSLEELRDGLERQRDRIFEATIKRLENSE